MCCCYQCQCYDCLCLLLSVSHVVVVVFCCCHCSGHCHLSLFLAVPLRLRMLLSVLLYYQCVTALKFLSTTHRYQVIAFTERNIAWTYEQIEINSNTNSNSNKGNNIFNNGGKNVLKMNYKQKGDSDSNSDSDSSYWLQVKYVMTQFDGLVLGYVSVVMTTCFFVAIFVIVVTVAINLFSSSLAHLS